MAIDAVLLVRIDCKTDRVVAKDAVETVILQAVAESAWRAQLDFQVSV